MKRLEKHLNPEGVGALEITEIRVSLTEKNADRLRAFCSITFDDMFVVRDIKIIEGPNGPFVAMPSRRIMTHCPKCQNKNHLRANYCNDCGEKQPNGVPESDNHRFYADIAHPINSQSREYIQNRIIEEFGLEVQRSTEPGYERQLDDDELQLSRKRKSHRPAPHHRRNTDRPSPSQTENESK